jgi:hypothetical protein
MTDCPLAGMGAAAIAVRPAAAQSRALPFKIAFVTLFINPPPQSVRNRPR